MNLDSPYEIIPRWRKKRKRLYLPNFVARKYGLLAGKMKLNFKGEQLLSSPLHTSLSLIFLIPFMHLSLPSFLVSVYLKTDTKTDLPATCKANAKLSRLISMETA